MSYEIEKTVPVNDGRFHARSVNGRTIAALPLAQMEVGDSVFVPSKDFEGLRTFRASLYLKAKVIGIQVSSRVVDAGLRIWRTA